MAGGSASFIMWGVKEKTYKLALLLERLGSVELVHLNFKKLDPVGGRELLVGEDLLELSAVVSEPRLGRDRLLVGVEEVEEGLPLPERDVVVFRGRTVDELLDGLREEEEVRVNLERRRNEGEKRT
jgi:hypothetical protein